MSHGLTTFASDTPRLIGAYDCGRSGPLMMVTAAIHGNEPAGVHALRRVFADLAATKPDLRGRLVGWIGNRGALAKDQRFVHTDLNRLWTQPQIQQILAADPALDHDEQGELRELMAAFEVELARPHDRVIHFDLHSTSGDSPPFTVLNQDVDSRALASALGVPAIFGLLKDVGGTVLDFAAARGFSCVVLEGGQNQAQATIDHHESGIWLLLEQTGMLRHPEIELHKARMNRSVANTPDAVEICFRYAIDPDEKFVMLPGFRSFQRVYRGQLLALGGPYGRSEIRCPIGGILLMPRYQGQGLDGFFLARAIQLVA